MSASPPRPTVSEMVSSKRFRLVAVVFIVGILFYLGFYHANDIRNLRQMTPSTTVPIEHEPSKEVLPALRDDVDWSRFAYGQYVTNSAYLCNSVMFFAKLHQLNSKADRVMMYPSKMLPDPSAASANLADGELLIKARDEYNVKLSPVKIQHKSNNDPTWADSFTKLLAFNQTQYDRVLSMDSDSTILQNMDELFLLPPVPVAMPRAYWLWPDNQILSSQIMLVQPSAEEFARIESKINSAGRSDYDMEIVNQLYRDSALIIPHRPYNLLTGEFKGKNHSWYLGNTEETWDPIAAFNEAKFLHFSDYPVPKPWLHTSEETMERNQPACETIDGREDCTARQLWNGFYVEFKERRKAVCNTGKDDGRYRKRAGRNAIV